MTVLSGQTIRRLGIVSPLVPRTSCRTTGMTYGLGPAGYDLTLDLGEADATAMWTGRFLLAATQERFVMPDDVLGVVHDKSTLARRGLAVQNTVIEPGWRGFLTLELTYHGPGQLPLFRGQPIAQVVFHRTDEPCEEPYPEDGRYQDQEAGPQGPR